MLIYRGIKFSRPAFDTAWNLCSIFQTQSRLPISADVPLSPPFRPMYHAFPILIRLVPLFRGRSISAVLLFNRARGPRRAWLKSHKPVFVNTLIFFAPMIARLPRHVNSHRAAKSLALRFQYVLFPRYARWQRANGYPRDNRGIVKRPSSEWDVYQSSNCYPGDREPRNQACPGKLKFMSRSARG